MGIIIMMAKLLCIPVSDSIGAISAELMMPDDATCLYVFAHGAGAGMHHPFMEKLSSALASRNIGTLRYNFPFMEKGGRRPDPPAIAEKTVSVAIKAAIDLYPDLPLLAGGKSFGGRMTSQYLSKVSGNSVKGIVFVGFPLHAPGNPGIDRANHLAGIHMPMLFLQGTRDALADMSLMEKVCDGHDAATLKKFEGADHSFKAGKQDLTDALAISIRDWALQLW